MEGKVDLPATVDGLLKIDLEALFEINAEEIVFATLHTNQRVAKGKMLAGTRVIPLVIEESKIELVETYLLPAQPLMEVLPFQKLQRRNRNDRERGLPWPDQGPIRSRRS